LAEKASRAPELVVSHPLNALWTCHRCGGTGDRRIAANIAKLPESLGPKDDSA
jgi:hypothetical protein